MVKIDVTFTEVIAKLKQGYVPLFWTTLYTRLRRIAVV